MESLKQASIFQLLGVLVSVAPLAMGIVFAIGPSEQRLSLMRPLSLAGIFAAICSLLLGLANGLQALARTDAAEPTSLRFAALLLSEAVVPAFIAFACLTGAWLCVAAGMRKQS
jgi:hypothetical protein